MEPRHLLLRCSIQYHASYGSVIPSVQGNVDQISYAYYVLPHHLLPQATYEINLAVAVTTEPILVKAFKKEIVNLIPLK